MRKIVRIATGIGLVLVGLILALPLVPGPGIPIAIMGLVILAEHFPWARKIVDWGKAKLEGAAARYRKPPSPAPAEPQPPGES